MTNNSVGDVHIHRQASDPEWDAFVAGAPGGTYQQSAMWGQVKAVLGWHSARVALRRDDRIVGGCQVLLRSLPVAGTVAYVPRGPVALDRGEATTAALLDGVRRLAHEERVLYLKVQPPPDRPDLADALLARGFVRSGLEAAPSATIRVDLTAPLEELFERMHHSYRRKVRRARRQGVTVRTGGGEDLATYAQLLEATRRRQQFAAYPRAYYDRMWEVFSPGGHARLLMAEHEGRALASVFLFAFGDTMVAKLAVWSGEHREIRPNELLHWSAIELAQQCGHRYYDFDGVDKPLVAALAAGDSTPVGAHSGVDGFKLRFGGELALFPPAYDVSPLPVIGGLLRRAGHHVDRLRPIANRVLGRRASLPPS